MFWLGFSTEEAPQTKWVPAVTQTEAVSFYLFWHISRLWLTVRIITTLTFPLCCQNTVKHKTSAALVHQHQILFLVPVSNFNRDVSALCVREDEYSRHEKAREESEKKTRVQSFVSSWSGEKLVQSRMFLSWRNICDFITSNSLSLLLSAFLFIAFHSELLF